MGAAPPQLLSRLLSRLLPETERDAILGDMEEEYRERREREGDPWECAECYVFLAAIDSSHMTGQVLHPNGGEIING